MDALHGIAGDFVRLIEPHTESDPAALFFQLLIGFGNLVGRQPYFRVEATRHHANTNVVVVGRTSKGRKGTAWGHVRSVLGAVDPAWAEQRIQDGLGSGEGLIHAVRDPIYKTESVKEGGRVVDHQQVMADAGVEDKRLLIAATEFAAPLRVAERDGNTLSTVIRNAWDTGTLRVLVKNMPVGATNAHVSILGHITKHELNANLNDTEAANGYGNRFLWIASERSKRLPDGGAVPAQDLERLQVRISEATCRSRAFTEVVRDADAARLWRAIYPALSEGKPGLLGAMLGRAEAQVTRLSLIFALLDASRVITEVHLRAALAAWQYVEDSAAFIFGATLGNPIADEIKARLKGAPDGLTKTDIRELFGNHRPTEQINAALTLLYDAGLAHRTMTPRTGRWAETWFAGAPPAKEAIEAQEGSGVTPLRSLPSLISQGASDVSETESDERAAIRKPDEELRLEREAIQGADADGSPKESAS